MAARKQLVVMVEGDGDVAAVPVLFRKLLGERTDDPYSFLAVDKTPPRRGNLLSRLQAREASTGQVIYPGWHAALGAARPAVAAGGGVLLLLDGDTKHPPGMNPFDPVETAGRLAEASRFVGGGVDFSVAVAFLVSEYETLFVASHESMPDFRPSKPPAGDFEEKGKRWVKDALRYQGGYKETADQERLTMSLDFSLVRPRMPSFGRLERAFDHLVTAVRDGAPVVTVGTPPVVLLPPTRPGD